MKNDEAMESEEVKKYESGFNEGVLFATQAVTSLILRTINQHGSWMLPGDRTQANATIRLVARFFLQRRGLVPSTYDVMRGNTEDVILDFNMDV